MPQMAPMNWVSLFIMFTILFIMINTVNYYSFNYTPLSTKTKKIFLKINWKW